MRRQGASSICSARTRECSTVLHNVHPRPSAVQSVDLKVQLTTVVIVINGVDASRGVGERDVVVNLKESLVLSLPSDFPFHTVPVAHDCS